MPIEDVVVGRIKELIAEAQGLRVADKYGLAKSTEDEQACNGWLAAATNIIQMVVPPDSPYRKYAEKIAGFEHGARIPDAVGRVGAILARLLKDAQSGLLSSIADHARAEVFDDFLDHAKAYLRDGRKNEAGVIAGVVFEDSVRRVCRKLSILEQGQELDALISRLAKSNTITATKAKRARVAAHVRTKATHAQWNEFELSDVKTTIDFTEEFIAAHVEN